MMGVEKSYEELVLRWGRELANEIIAKQMLKPTSHISNGNGRKRLDMLDSKARLTGSFESGKKR
jgi:hypothetical protein